MLDVLGVDVVALNISRRRPSPIGFIRLVSLLRQHSPDVVQTWMYHADLFGGLAARVAGIKSVNWGIHHSMLERGTLKNTTIWIVRILSNLSWWVPWRIAVCAQRAKDVHEALGYSPEKMRVIPNGYDLAEFRPERDPDSSIRSSLKVSPSIPLIGTVGRFDPQKDHANLLGALAIVRSQNVQFQCVLVGTGLDDGNAVLAEMIGKLGLSGAVHLLGRRTDIPQVMNALDLHVLPSAGEAFPNVVAEAMACGTPCVVTDVGDAGFIVGDTGWVIPPRDSIALADAIMAALTELNSSTWQARCDASRARIEEYFSIERMVRSYTELWSGRSEFEEEAT